MPLVKFSKVTTMLVFVVIMILMSSELASAAFDSIPIFKLGRRVLQVSVNSDYPVYAMVPGGGGGYPGNP
ncbi:hypothetical protein ACOSQ2_009941 [Xanthoceras sorbifolium]